MGIFKTTFFIVGTSIGAGFLSGAELVRFFGTERVLLPVLLSSAVFFCLSALFLRLGKKYNGMEGALHALFGRAAKGMEVLFAALSFIPCAGMLAGLDALFPALSPLISLSGLGLVLCFLRRGMGGISLLNSLLVPVLLLFVLLSRGGTLFFPGRTGHDLGVLYAGMNSFLALPVLLEAGREAKRPVLSAFLASAVVCVSALFVLGRIFSEGAGALDAELPFLYAMRGRKSFFAASALAILTSLGSALYPLLRLCERAKRKNAAKGGVLFAAFLFSRLGLAGIVRFFYPAVGALGLLFSVVCVLHEYLFEQHHQKVHRRGKQAEDTGGSHHKVELEHLPAVHDEVS